MSKKKKNNNWKQKAGFQYPQDCKFYLTQIEELNEDIRAALSVENKLCRTYRHTSFKVEEVVVNEFLFRLSENFARIVYSVVDSTGEGELERLIKLGWQFGYLAVHKDEIGEEKILRMAPSFHKMLQGEGPYYYVELGEDCCYYSMVTLGEDNVHEKFMEGYNTIMQEVQTLVSNHIHQKGFACMCSGEAHVDFYFYDELPLYEQQLSTLSLSENDRNSLLRDGELTYGINLYGYDISDGYESWNILDVDFSVGDPSVFCYAQFFWGKTREWACGFADTLDELIACEYPIDEYDLEKKAPTLYKALLNAQRKQIDKGALFLFPGKSFFLCQYTPDIDDQENEQLFENCRKTVYRISEETERYVRHLQLQGQKEVRRNDSSGNGFLKRYVGMELFRALLNGF